MIILGVDPGLVKTGFSLVDSGKVFYHKTVDGKLAIKQLLKIIQVYHFARAVVEKPRQSVLYKKHLYGIKNRFVSEALKFKICMDIGKNILISDMIIETLKDSGIKVKIENPMAGETKWDTGKWRKAFEYEGRLPSEHARDAAVRALKNEKWVGWELTQERIDAYFNK